MKYLLIVLLMLSSNYAFGDDFEAVRSKLNTAMDSDIRTDTEKARDRNRRPVETLEFFGLRDDMTIIELMPGGGWYSKLLVPVVKDKGKFYAAYGTSRLAGSLYTQPGFEGVTVLAADAAIYSPEGADGLLLENADLGITDADMVLTFRNYHNFGTAGRAAMNKAAFDALKHGGIYAVVDHSRRHMEPDSPENGRRVDPVMAIKEIQAAGFKLLDYSTVNYRADDELRYEVGRKTVTGNTDRFTLKFVKP